MKRDKQTDIWFVFRVLKFEVNFCDFICLTCILCSLETWTLTTKDETIYAFLKGIY